jgi:RNA polymerase sigma-70 factor (ECF subfamily)
MSHADFLRANQISKIVLQNRPVARLMIMKGMKDARRRGEMKNRSAVNDGAGRATAEAALDFTALVGRFETPLLRYAEQILGRRGDEAQDVVQEVFLRYHRQVAERGATSVANPACWLFRVAHNVSLDVARKREGWERARGPATRAAEDRQADLGAAAEAAAELVRREAQERALEELQRLPEAERQVLLLKVIQGLTLREIGEVLGMSIGNVDYHLNQGLRELARRLREAGVL